MTSRLKCQTFITVYINRGKGGGKREKSRSRSRGSNCRSTSVERFSRGGKKGGRGVDASFARSRYRVASGEKYSRVSDAGRNAGVGKRRRESTGGIDCDTALGTCPIHDHRLLSLSILPPTYLSIYTH